MQLDEWREQIQELSGGSVVVIHVETEPTENVLRIPAAFAGRPIAANLLRQETFVAQFVRAHALSVNYTGAEGTFHFVFMNMARQKDWEGMEDSLLAHELGHIWLHANGYRAPAYNNSCLSTHTGDIVQHILIREETRRRGFDYMRFWIRNQEKWLAEEEKSDEPGVLDECHRLQLISAWMDAALGLTSAKWNQLERFLRLLRSKYSDLEPIVKELTVLLSGLDLWDRSVYELALARVSRKLRSVTEP